jgi:transcriptional regulator with XRE-family HTH domain
MDIGSHIKELRLEKNLSRKALSELIGLSPGYIEEIESNKKKPTIDTLLKFSAFYSVTISELIGEIQNDLAPELRELLDTAKQLSPDQVNLLNNFLQQIALGHKPKYVKTTVDGEKVSYMYNTDERPEGISKEEETENKHIADRIKDLIKDMDEEDIKKLERQLGVNLKLKE